MLVHTKEGVHKISMRLSSAEQGWTWTPMKDRIQSPAMEKVLIHQYQSLDPGQLECGRYKG